MGGKIWWKHNYGRNGYQNEGKLNCRCKGYYNMKGNTIMQEMGVNKYNENTIIDESVLKIIKNI